MVREGGFREDLYYRLNVVPVYLPSLRDRHGDVAKLAMAFLERSRNQNPKVRSFTPEAMAKMESYDWPGNVRELRNIVERITILCNSEVIESWHLPPEIQQVTPRPLGMPLPKNWEDFKKLKQQVRDATGQELERRYVTETLERCDGNVSRAAKEIGIQRTNLHALMRRYGISVDKLAHDR